MFGAFSAGSKANARFRRDGRGCGPLPVIDFICDLQNPPAIAPSRPEASADFAFSPAWPELPIGVKGHEPPEFLP